MSNSIKKIDIQYETSGTKHLIEDDIKGLSLTDFQITSEDRYQKDGVRWEQPHNAAIEIYMEFDCHKEVRIYFDAESKTIKVNAD